MGQRQIKLPPRADITTCTSIINANVFKNYNHELDINRKTKLNLKLQLRDEHEVRRVFFN